MHGCWHKRSAAVLLFGTIGIGCNQGESSPDTAAESKPAPADPAKTEEVSAKAKEDPGPPGVRPDGEVVPAVAWFDGTLEEALATAKAQGKQVFIDVGAYWCPPCHRLDEEVFVKQEVGAALAKDYIALHIDAEKGEGPELVERYQVQAYPTMLVLESSGIEKGRIVDFLEPTAFLEALGRLSAGGNVLQGMIEAVENAPDDLGKRYALAHAYLLAADVDAANPHLDAVMVGDPKDELSLASRVLYDRAMFVTYKVDGKPRRAIEKLDELQRRFPQSRAAVRAYRLKGRLHCKLGEPDQAIASLEAMIATAPEDAGLAASYGWFAFRQKCGAQPALAAVEKGITIEGDNADLHYVQAELLLALGRAPQAVASIEAAAKLEPRSAFYQRQVRRMKAAAEAAG